MINSDFCRLEKGRHYTSIIAVLALTRINSTSPYHGIRMKKCLFTILVVIGLSSVLTIGNTLSAIVVQPLYSSPEQQSDDEQQQDEAADEEPVEEPEPEHESPSEDLPISDEREDTSAAQEPIDPQAEKEICVTNAKGQKFCYKELEPDEVCLKPINAEDPPICPPPKTEGIVNGTSTAVEGTSSVGGEAGDPVPDIDVKLPCPRKGKPVCPP